mmetsp:Transcript_88337/g.234920  ORF Transcript_88337/g.234920 Transcript_88337/m.234920 type:complete len:154 (-) Transcript_88337:449-910(-)
MGLLGRLLIINLLLSGAEHIDEQDIMDKLSTPRSETRVPHGFKLKTMPNGANSNSLRNPRMDFDLHAEKLDMNGRSLAHSTSDKDLQNHNSRPCSVGSNSSQVDQNYSLPCVLVLTSCIFRTPWSVPIKESRRLTPTKPATTAQPPRPSPDLR